MKEIFDKRSQAPRNTVTDKMISKIPKQTPAITLPEILFNNSTVASKIWPVLARKILNEDIHAHKDPNYIEFFEKFEIEAAYHSADIEKTEKKKKVFELHKARLREVNEDGIVEGRQISADTKLLESYLFGVSNLTKNKFKQLQETERPKSRNGLRATSPTLGLGLANHLFLGSKKIQEQTEIQTQIEFIRRQQKINRLKQ